MDVKKLNESVNDEITVFMNTWANYNENGADGGITPTGWMTVDEARDYMEEYADYEPFINDVDNPTEFDLDINEYSGPDALDEIETINNMDGYDREALAAILNSQGGSFEDALNIFESGDYSFYPGISSLEDLAYEMIDELGGISNAVSDPTNYIDEDAMRRDYEYDVRDMMYDDAPSQIADELDIEEEDVTEEMIEDWIDENMESYLDSIIEEEMYLAEQGEIDLTNYFDYEAFGRDLGFDGWSIESTGAINVF